MNAQANAANQLSSVASTAEQNQQQQYAQSQALEAPLVAQETALASGNRTAAVNAAMPTISTLSQGYNAALSQIQDTLPPGAARDQAVAQLQRQEYTGIAGAQASAVQQAPQVLAQLGAGDAGLSVQELGAALSGYTSSANAQGQVAAEGNAQKANQLSFFGQLAGAAGSAASGFNLGGSSQDASTSAANADNSVPFQVAWT
jgi:hypothetical protein